jgi:hypothetical protein
MPKAGTYDYPTRDLDDCVNYLRKARETAGTQTVTREGFAQAMGMSVKGGGYGLLVGSMADYGLVDTGGGQIRITDLGERVVFGEGDEKRKAMEEAVRNVLLFADIFQRYNGVPSDEQVHHFLREKAQVPIAEAKPLIGKIGNLLKKNLPYLTTAPGGGGGDKKVMNTDDRMPTGQFEEYKLGGGVVVNLPKEDTAKVWAKAKKALDILLGLEETD